MKSEFSRQIGVAAATAFAGGAVAWGLGTIGEAQPTERHIKISARQYAFDPPRIKVNRGDTVHLRIVSHDVIHGLYLEGHDIDAEIRPQTRTILVKHPANDKPDEELEELTFVAKRRGKFRYRCSHTCGTLHPFMTGELIVGPNTPLHVGIGGVVGLFIGFLFALRRNGNRPGVGGDGEATT